MRRPGATIDCFRAHFSPAALFTDVSHIAYAPSQNGVCFGFVWLANWSSTKIVHF